MNRKESLFRFRKSPVYQAAKSYHSIPLPLDACLREAASAEAGGRVRVGANELSPLSLIPSRQGRGGFSNIIS
jgi:hypothetical protein